MGNSPLTFIGAIQLALNVAGRSDKANMALSWMMDGQPQPVRRPSSGMPYNANVDIV